MDAHFWRPLDVFVCLAVAAAGAWHTLAQPGGEGATAVVSIDNRVAARFALRGDPGGHELQTSIGLVRLLVSGAGIRVAQASCPKKLCMGMGLIHHTHQKIVCVPGRMLVRIEGRRDPGNPGTVDGVTR